MSHPSPRSEDAADPDAIRPPLIETKLNPPSPRAALVSRRRLIARAVEGGARKLTLIAAPAGSGKTTLLTDWRAAAADRLFAWLALDAQDNDPMRFWTYAIEAIRRAAPAVGERSLGLLRARALGVTELALPALANELLSADGGLTFVLDDYHVITNPEIHEQLAFLLEVLPSGVEIALATRVDPPFPLARLRVRRELLEIRADDLRFTLDETAAFLNEALGLGLSTGQVAELQRRTEGWAAGLYLAALSLAGRQDASTFISGFAGDDRQIVDYLGAESLSGLSDEVRTFLLRTSILDRLCGSLCDAITGGANSADLLRETERSNLFLIPLDRRREWYRYHHLFAEVLRHELRASDASLIPVLHRRAAAWFEDRGLASDAIRHALAAGDVASAVDGIARNWNDYFNRGELATVAQWLDALTDDVVRTDPRLCVARAWLHLDAGRLDDAERWVDAAEARVRERALDASFDSAAADTAMLRAVYRFKVGSVDDAHEAALAALELMKAQSAFSRTVAHCIVGITEYWQGSPIEARRALRRAVELARTSHNDLAARYALGYLAIIEMEAGRLEEAAELSRDARDVSGEPGITEHFVAMLDHLALGEVLERRGELGAAWEELSRAVELGGRGAGRLERIRALVAAAPVRHAQRDRHGAARDIEHARQLLSRCPEPGIAAELVAQAERELRLGRPPAAAGSEGAVEALTDRELAVLRLLPGGMSLSEIASELYVSRNTVKTHAKNVYRKLGASTRGEAVSIAREMQLLRRGSLEDDARR